MFDITHLVVFDYFACDLEKATIELPVSQGTTLMKAETETFFKVSELLEEKLEMSIDGKLRQLAVEKKGEVDSMLKVLWTKQEELEGGDFLHLILERDKREAVLKEEIANMKTALEEKELQLENTLHQKDTQLQQKDAQLQQKDAQLRVLHAKLTQQHTLLQQKDAQLKQKDVELRHKDEESGHQYAVLLYEHQQLQQEHDQLRRERYQLLQGISRSLSAKPVGKKPPRSWIDMKCQKILKCGGGCWAVDTKGKYIAVGVPNSIEVYDRSGADLLRNIGKDQLGDVLPGVIFYDHENILVSDYSNSNIKMFTIQGQHVHTIDRGSTTFTPCGITISPEGHIYVCDADNDCVCVFDVNRKFLFSFCGGGSCGSGDECLDCFEDLYFASDGFLYITDEINKRICVYDKDGKFIRKFTTAYQPTCIDATDCGHLIVSSLLSHKVMIYTTGGDLVHVFGEHGSELGQFDGPTGVSVDSDGLIYIADLYNHRIQLFQLPMSSVSPQIL